LLLIVFYILTLFIVFGVTYWLRKHLLDVFVKNNNENKSLEIIDCVLLRDSGCEIDKIIRMLEEEEVTINTINL